MGLFGLGLLVQGDTPQAAPATRVRIETRPPARPSPNAALSALHAVWDRCVDRLRPGRMPSDIARRKRLREHELGVLHAAKDEFDDALWNLPADAVGALQEQVDAARSLHELWYLRAGVFSAVARHVDQETAGQVLAGLNRHFPTRAARSGFATLDDLS